MKIFCVGRNYARHAEEMGADAPEVPMIFMKPPTAYNNKDYMYYPDFTEDLEHEVELVLKVCKNGKSIAEKHAHRYYNEVALGIDFCARDLQTVFKQKGHPWEISKGFDNAGFVSGFQPIESLGDPILFSLEKNGEVVQRGDTSLMIFSFDKIVSYISNFFTIQMGDLIYTGTPEGVGNARPGDIFVGRLGEEEAFKLEIR